MDNFDRAKQFLAFDALGGLSEAIKQKEVENDKEYEVAYEKEENMETNLHNLSVH